MDIFTLINRGESSINFNGDLNPCYTHYMRYVDCAAGEPLTRLLCRDKYLDFIECKQNIKKNEFQAFYSNEFKKLKILSIPKYDDVTDSFVDGNGPTSSASFFKDDERMKQFFELHANFKLEQTKKHKSH